MCLSLHVIAFSNPIAIIVLEATFGIAISQTNITQTAKSTPTPAIIAPQTRNTNDAVEST